MLTCTHIHRLIHSKPARGEVNELKAQKQTPGNTMLIHAASGQRQTVTTLSAWILPDGSRICVNVVVCMFVNMLTVPVKIEVS